MDDTGELIELCFDFLVLVNILYNQEKITKEEYDDMSHLKIQFLQKCGVGI